MDAADRWPELIHRALRELSVRQVAFVPDAGHARLIELGQPDPSLHAVPLTASKRINALAAGAWRTSPSSLAACARISGSESLRNRAMSAACCVFCRAS